jgi:hypothetical protein
MPITGPTSYPPTVAAFINHWLDANALLGSSPLVLNKDAMGTANDVDVTVLQDLFTQLEAVRDVVATIGLDLSIYRAEAEALKAELHERLNDFNSAVRADHPNSAYARVLPAVPSINEGRGRFLRPLRDAAKLWVKVNVYRAGSPAGALVLKGAYTVDTFAIRVNSLAGKYDTMEEAEQQFSLEIQNRNDVQDLIYPILRAYRAKLPTIFAAGSAIVNTLPALSPSPGSTPAAPGLSGGYNASMQRADFTGVPSTSPSVVKHQLRICLSADYDADLEQVATTIEGNLPLNYTVTTGLTTPGGVISARLYAMTEDGHEAGSDTVVVNRPV